MVHDCNQVIATIGRHSADMTMISPLDADGRHRSDGYPAPEEKPEFQPNRRNPQHFSQLFLAQSKGARQE